MKRKVLAVLFATALTAGMLSGCGSTDSTSEKADQKEESLEEETSEGQTGVDEETAANAVSEEEAEAAGFSDHEESTDDQEASGDAEDTSHETEASADSSADSTEDTDSADGEFSDGSEDAQMAGTTVIDTSQQLTGTHHAAITVKDYGEIDVELDADTAPITVTNFVKLVQDNFYDGLTFHRIIDGFMIQGGDPNGDGTGGAEDTIKGEFSSNGFENGLSHTRGVVSMARTNVKDSASGQFFIMHGDADYLDGNYAAFGRVVEGMEYVDEIANSPVDGETLIEKPVMKTVKVLKNYKPAE